jgi:hypothetical protein
MPLEPRPVALASLPNRRDPLSEELEAMAAIARVLEGISDPAVRQRVLRWTNERFALIEKPQSGSASVEIPHDDPALAVDSLDDLFSNGRPGRPGRDESRDKFALVANRPVETTLRSFVADFQRLAKDWQDI